MPISSNFRYLSNIYIWNFAQIQTLLFFMSLHKYREMAHIAGSAKIYDCLPFLFYLLYYHIGPFVGLFTNPL